MKTSHATRNTLRHHRRTAGDLSQQDLAERVGVTRQTIIAIEKGNYNPSVGLALRLAEVFGVAVEDLFTLSTDNHDATV